MQDHFEDNERQFNSVPLVRFTGIVSHTVLLLLLLLLPVLLWGKTHSC